MIQANELRIGNYVVKSEQVTSNSPEYGQITTVYIDKAVVDYHYPLTWYKPISLTEEWLLKFGFTSIDNTNIYVKSMHKIGAEKLKSLAVYIDEKDYTIAIVDYYTGVEKTDLLHLNYKYVHQLQNLYFALTGEELTVKE